jgi:hypothetical protein
MELVIQYGYVVLFSTAFTLTPLLAWILNIIEIRVDAFKLVHLTRRPFPFGASTIGNWNGILQIISFLGVFVNAGIIVFTANVFNFAEDDIASKWLAFFVIDHALLILKSLISYAVPDEN